jgi:hypothetical protein
MGARHAHSILHRGDARRDDAAAARPEHLQVDVLMPRVDRDRDAGAFVGGDMRRGEGCERRQSERGLARGERNAARRGNADAQSGEAARAGGDADPVERGIRHVGLLHHAVKQRHQRLGVSPLHRQRLGRHLAMLGVDHGGGAGFEGGVDGEDSHGWDSITS